MLPEAPGLLFTALAGLGGIVILALSSWLLSVWRRDVSIVDSFWSLFICCAGLIYAGIAYESNGGALPPRAWLVLGLLVIWALRLSVYLTLRNHGRPEDRRYQQIRARNQPHFEWKSLYLIFGLQAVLAWAVSLPVLAVLQGDSQLSWLDALGGLLSVFGLLSEAVADQQMARFKSQLGNRGQVMDRGLWRYSRHPNYFGECCVWWGLFVMALAAGGWWSIVAPLLMTVLLLKVSGVTLLEADLRERRPGYRDYIRRTPAFFPGPPRGDAP